MLFSGADGLDFPMPGSYSMAGDPGAHGGMGHYGGAAPGMPLVLPTEHGGGHVIAAWEPPPQDAENGSAEQVRNHVQAQALQQSGTRRLPCVGALAAFLFGERSQCMTQLLSFQGSIIGRMRAQQAFELCCLLDRFGDGIRAVLVVPGVGI